MPIFFATPLAIFFHNFLFNGPDSPRTSFVVFFSRMTCMLVSFTTHTTHNSPEIYLFSATTGDNEESKLLSLVDTPGKLLLEKWQILAALNESHCGETHGSGSRQLQWHRQALFVAARFESSTTGGASTTDQSSASGNSSLKSAVWIRPAHQTRRRCR